MVQLISAKYNPQPVHNEQCYAGCPGRMLLRISVIIDWPGAALESFVQQHFHCTLQEVHYVAAWIYSVKYCGLFLNWIDEDRLVSLSLQITLQFAVKEKSHARTHARTE